MPLSKYASVYVACYQYMKHTTKNIFGKKSTFYHLLYKDVKMTKVHHLFSTHDA